MITDWIFEFAAWLRQAFCRHEYKVRRKMITDWIFEFAVWLKQAFCHHEYKELFDYHLEITFYQCQKCGRKRINEPPKPLIK